ncbi:MULTISPECIES: hypothetical protein [Vibrio]|nr:MULTISPECIES: hypothetical protein [Vibrio]MDA0125808.1 hypothetical protein [Vibrio sp. MM46]WDZ74285.1 hypothetical protein PWW31_29155 [Vibrio harveyi]GEA20013.1 hypothetical protein VH1807_contig00001-0096 [Vibrio harveyi]HDM8056404.1 hypothetical protein [Vibrio harveyi]HDM8194159.1 hypothetical protein [Vibrio harveyi]
MNKEGVIHNQLIHEGVDMLNQKENDVVLSALEVVIDGVSSSEASEKTRVAGVYITGLILADTKGLLEIDSQKAVSSIIRMVHCRDKLNLFIDD